MARTKLHRHITKSYGHCDDARHASGGHAISGLLRPMRPTRSAIRVACGMLYMLQRSSVAQAEVLGRVTAASFVTILAASRLNDWAG